MKLQILIPQYTETDEIIKPLLNSIAIQQGIDFSEIGVIIINDGSDIRLTNFIFDYPFRVKYYATTEHEGVSATRNHCLEQATADYVMFCDADDMFYSVRSLFLIFTKIKEGFDTLVSTFLEEGRDENNQSTYAVHVNDAVFVHGKVHRRQYLLENKIFFLPALTIHEDSYFNIQCQELTENIAHLEEPIYLWKWRDDSICRKDPKYGFKTMTNLIDTNDALISTFYFERGRTDSAQKYASRAVLDFYYMMQRPDWQAEENKEYRNTTEQYFALFYKKWHKLWETVDAKEFAALSNAIRERTISEGMLMEKETLEQWLEHIRNLS